MRRDKVTQNDNHEMLMKTSVLAGELLAISGAEIYRVEETIQRILEKGAFNSIQVVAMMTSIVATVEREGMEPLTYVKSIHERGMNLTKIIAVNQISRDFCEEKITLEEANIQLKQLTWKQYKRDYYNLAIIGIVVGFALFLGGTMLEAGLAILVGAALAGTITLCKKLGVNALMSNIVGGLGIALVSSLLARSLEGVSQDILIISGIMPLVPGVAITNAVRDLIHADYVSGNARISKAIMVAAAIAIGIGTGLSVSYTLL